MKKDFSYQAARIRFDEVKDGVIPAIIQDESSQKVIMLGHMNEEALQQTIDTGKVIFYSRSKKVLWLKGSTSKNYLYLRDILPGCDFKSVLIKVNVEGVVCHTGAETCYNELNNANDFLRTLEKIIEGRKKRPVSGSYTSTLFKSGTNFMSQKFGESALRLVIESKDRDDRAFVQEAADTLFHFLVMLKARNKDLNQVLDILEKQYTRPDAGTEIT